MSTRTRFSESAKLYAENAPIVDEMRSRFRTDVDRFLREVVETLDGILPSKIQTKTTSSDYTYWWMGDDNVDRNKIAHAWFTPLDPRIVHPGTLELTIVAPDTSPGYRNRVSQLVQHEELSSYTRPSSKVVKYDVFKFAVEYSEETPVEEISRPIAELFTALGEIPSD